MIEYHGSARVASSAVVAKRATSVAVSKPRPKTTPTGYICHSVVIERIHPPKNRFMSPRLCELAAPARPRRKLPVRIDRRTPQIPARMTMFNTAIR